MIRRALAILVISTAIIAGCTHTEPTRFFILSPTAGGLHDKPALSGGDYTSVGVGPVEIPDYLNRPQLVLRKALNEIELAEFSHWAEPLDRSISRILTENLCELLCADAFSIFPWRGPSQPDYRAAVDVVRFDGDLGAAVTLVARWSIFGDKGKEPLSAGTFQHTSPVDAPSYESLIAAYNAALEALSRELAAEIRSLARP